MNHQSNLQHPPTSGVSGQGVTVQDVTTPQAIQNQAQHIPGNQRVIVDGMMQNMIVGPQQDQPKVVLVTMPDGIGGSGEGDVEIIVTTHLSPTDDDSMYVLHNNETEYQQLENATVGNIDLPQSVSEYNCSLLGANTGHQTVHIDNTGQGAVNLDSTGHQTVHMNNTGHTVQVENSGHSAMHVDNTGHGDVHMDGSAQASYQQSSHTGHLQTFQAVHTSANAIYNSAISSGIIPSTQNSAVYSSVGSSGIDSSTFQSTVNTLPDQQMISLSRFPVNLDHPSTTVSLQIASMAESGQQTSIAPSAGVQSPDVNSMTPEDRELYEKQETMKSLELVEAQWKSSIAESSKSSDGVIFPENGEDEEDIEGDRAVFAFEVVDIGAQSEQTQLEGVAAEGTSENQTENVERKLDCDDQTENKIEEKAADKVFKAPDVMCTICKKKFNDIEALQSHVMSQCESQAFTCTMCGSSFADAQSLRQHETNHSLTCERCNKTFTTAAYLKSHMRTHTGEKIHVCDVCGESFTFSNMLRRHKMKYHKEVLKTCDICSKEFVSAALLRRHMQEHEPSQQTGRKQKDPRGRKSKTKTSKKTTKTTSAQMKVKIPVAGTRPQTRGLKKKQAEEKAGKTKTHDPPKESVFTCMICQEKFQNKVQFKKHAKTHLGQRILRCDKCGKVFQDSIKLKMHKLSHKGESVSCDFCGRSFSYASTLAIHKKTHCNEKGFQCRICKKRFATADLMKAHKATHTTTKAFVCDTCEKAFTSQYYLKAHKRLHTGEKHYGCLQCGESFMFSTGLRRHVNKAHNEPADKKQTTEDSKGETSEPVDKEEEFDNDDPDYVPLSIDQDEDSVTDSKKIKYNSSLVLKLIKDEDGMLKCQCCDKKFQSTPALNTHMKEHVDFPHTCHICKKTFSRKLYLQKHLQRHNDDKPFNCKDCGKNFRSAAYLEQHQQIHTGEKSYQCQLCGMEFIFANSLRRHLKTHDDIGPNIQGLVRKKRKGKNYRPVSEFSPEKVSQLKCVLCGYSFQTLPKLEEHMKSHSGENPVYECSVCKKEFNSHRALWRHRQSHVDDQPITCEICQKTFRSSYYLKSHMNLHSGKKPYKCKHCDLTFVYASTRRRHMRIHIPEESMNYMCSICGKKFFEQGEFDRHILGHSGEKPFMCDVCGKTFATKALLRSHMNRHNGERQYKCQMCNKMFLYRYRLQRHIKTHSGVKSFLCNVCGKGFLTQAYLQTHLRFHTGEKPYKCEECGEEFSFSNTFRRHKRIHTGQTLNCGVCGKMCLELFDLKRHMQSHSDQKTVMCDICGKTFSHQGSCKRHMRRTHPEAVMPFQVPDNLNVEIQVS